MKIKVKKKYLDTELEMVIDSDDTKKSLLKASIFTCKDVCFLCNGTDISLVGKKTGEGHIYISRKCTDIKCGAESNLGSFKDGSGHFWKEWSIWKPELSEASQNPTTNKQGFTPQVPPPPVEGGFADDLPF